MEEGDFILIDYVTTIEETGETFDTTLEDAAKEGRVFKEDVIYEPMLVVVGQGWVLEALDRSLIGLEVGEQTVIKIPPEEGFGLRDPSKIRMVSARRFRGEDADLYPGAQVEADGSLAVVRSVGSGRVLLDFNPPLAGKTLVYDLSVKSRIEDEEEKIKALIHRRIPSVEIDKFEVEIAGKALSIEFPEEAFYLERVQLAKRGIASDIQRLSKKIEEVAFLERFVKPRPQSGGGTREPGIDEGDTEWGQ